LIFAALALGVKALRAEQQWLFWPFVYAALAAGVVWFFRRFMRPSGSVDPAKPGFLLSIARTLRTSSAAVGAYRFIARPIAPLSFLTLTAILVFALAHRVLFDLLSAGGVFCEGSAALKANAAEMNRKNLTPPEKIDATATWRTNSLCHATGLQLIAGRKYRIRIEMDGGVNGVDGDWFDRGIRADVAGFTSDAFPQNAASLLKRWWHEDWFQPIARIGEVGNYEHVLQ